MPTSLSFDEHVSAIEVAGHRLADLAAVAGDEAKVPTCPAWDVRALVAHQTMVHRWATAHVTGADPAAVPKQTEIRRSVDDLESYFAEGVALLITALRSAPADLDAMTFLNDAPAPREFWARRQAHETTVHAIDALAATLGRAPSAAEAEIGRDVAVDGIDELLAGFFTRGRSKLFNDEEFTMLVAPDDSDRRWNVKVAETLAVSSAPGEPPRITIGGTAVAIYLGLWNRCDEIKLEGDAALMDRWRETQKVRWS